MSTDTDTITDVTNDEKRAILLRGIKDAKVGIYDHSVIIEAKKIAGYSEQEIAPIVTNLERLIKMRDALQKKLDELSAAQQESAKE